MKHLFLKAKLLGSHCILRYLIISLLFCSQSFTASAQCPPNIDFELGDFTGWECWIGSHYIIAGGKDTIDLGTTPVAPVTGRHTMLTAVPGDGLDTYGRFPKNCPNGSGHSVQVGDASIGVPKAQGVSYTFTIPPGQDKFSLIYYYAIVLHLPPHPQEQKPKLVISVENLTDGTPLPCPLEPFIPGNGIPGFFDSPLNPEVKCKDWAAATINLDNLAGKTIRLFFKTANCTPNGHFGYAYIDVASQCSSSFVGATFCPDDTSVTISAPAGYQNYTWYDGLHTTVIGNGQTITLKPPPLSGDSLKVDLVPFNGYGCPNTLTSHLWDTLTVHAIAGPDQSICDNTPVQLGTTPEPGRVYKWSPTTGLSNPNIANPIATPGASTTYTLTVTNNGGGCSTPDVVTVNVAELSDEIVLDGVASYCIGSGQHARLILTPLDADSIQWYQDGNPIPGPIGHQPSLTVTQTGAYHATLFSFLGCSKTTVVKQINIYETPVAGFAVNTAAQCQAGNEFIFTNSSTLTTGTLQYAWDLGDNTTGVTRDITHTYSNPGPYSVKLLVTAPGGCTDFRTIDIIVNPSSTASFSVNNKAQCFKNNEFVFSNGSTTTAGTMQYVWDMGDLTTFNTKDVTHSYTTPGTYTVKLTAIADGGCQDDSTFDVTVEPTPAAGFAINTDVQCFPGHQFDLTNTSTVFSGTLQYEWNMGDATAIQTTQDVNYSYALPGAYKIKLLAYNAFGCKDSLTKDVIVHATPFADFTVRPICENLQVPIINRTFNNTVSTVNYLWDFGNGHTDNVKSPVYSYPAGGTYDIKLSVSTVQCPVSFDTKTLSVTIDVPAPGIMYPDKDAAFNFPEPLQARPIGNNIIWTPATSLSNRFSYTPTFTGINPQLYTIQIKTATGCITVDTQLVKTHKKIEIYVPTGFTPDGDGNNDRLRPVLIGFSKVNYFRIYNRWGQMLFTMNSDQPGWDGLINNKPAETQTVIWMIEAVDVDGKVHNKQGTTVLYR